MNFKKYHVSRNLFDISKVVSNVYVSNQGDSLKITTPSTTAGVVAGSPYTLQTYCPNLQVGDVVTLSFVSTGSSKYIYLQGENIAWSSGQSKTITSTMLSSAIIWYASGVSTEAIISNIMLNLGSKALPYEPYSSEVWHDIPYYQHKTATDTLTLPAVIYPNDTSITVGLKGNEEHTGTPSPQNPVMPNGTGERTGNLWDGNYENGLLNTDGTLNAPNVNYNTTMYIPTEEKNYTLSVICNYDSSLRLLRVCFYDENKNFISYVDSPGFRGKDFFYKFNFTAPVNSKYLRFSYIFKVGMSDTNIMLNTGSTALPYEKFGYKIPISSANTTTPVYLGEVESTRRIKKLVLTGEENWRLGTHTAERTVGYITIDEPLPLIAGYCTHIEFKLSYSATEYNRIVLAANPSYLYLSLETSLLSDATLNDFKSYLAAQYAAGTPVTVWYVLSTPQTGIVNEPLMKVGDYADSLTTTIPCTAGENTLDVQTTVAPSEVTVNYKGWHPVADVHEADNGAWT